MARPRAFSCTTTLSFPRCVISAIHVPRWAAMAGRCARVCWDLRRRCGGSDVAVKASPSSNARFRDHPSVWAMLCAVLVLLAYARVGHADFIWDDDAHV